MTDLLIDQHEILFRQIHPEFMQNGEPSSQPFCPTAKDESKLSVDRSTLTTAARSFELFKESGLGSRAVYGLQVKEFGNEKITCYSDPILANGDILANLAHAFADYSAHSKTQQKMRAKRLKTRAIARGQLFP